MALLDDVKKSLRVTHSDDDDEITRLVGSAVREVLRALDSADYPVPAPGDAAADVTVPEEVVQAVVILVKADYDADPKDRAAYRKAAIDMVTTYRTLGIA